MRAKTVNNDNVQNENEPDKEIIDCQLSHMDKDMKIPSDMQDKTINEFGTELEDKINTNTSAHTKEGEHEDEWDVWLIS